jgi:diaminohydroxyphosphoribosylaminopyrimidine deaminase/5-amino-6-(5-phosphoribosylamino)uracil reductase
VGRGWHRAYGGPHAEVEALRAAAGRARGATAYVSLEPCSTVGKTGACTDALAAAGVAEVVWAATDPDRGNGGRAARALGRAGIATRGPSLPEPGAAALEPLARRLSPRRPWVVLKWAASLDGRVSPARGEGARLSGERAARFVHDLRGRCEAVAVGVGTVLADDPLLTCRASSGPALGRQPLRVVFDSRLRTPRDAAVVASASPHAPVLLAHAGAPASRVSSLSRPGVSFLCAPARGGAVDVAAVLRALRERGVARLLVEGGSRLSASFVRAGLADQVFAILTPLLLGGSDAPPALDGTGIASLSDAPRLSSLRTSRLGQDLLVRAYV